MQVGTIEGRIARTGSLIGAGVRFPVQAVTYAVTGEQRGLRSTISRRRVPRVHDVQMRTATSAGRHDTTMQECTIGIARSVTTLAPTESRVRGIETFRATSVQNAANAGLGLPAKSLKGMVGATGIEPVTPSMSRRCSSAELRARPLQDLPS